MDVTVSENLGAAGAAGWGAAVAEGSPPLHPRCICNGQSNTCDGGQKGQKERNDIQVSIDNTENSNSSDLSDLSAVGEIFTQSRAIVSALFYQ